MKVIESEEKRFCDNCYTYGYTWDIYTSKDSAVPQEMPRRVVQSNFGKVIALSDIYARMVEWQTQRT